MLINAFIKRRYNFEILGLVDSRIERAVVALVGLVGKYFRLEFGEGEGTLMFE